MKVQRIVKTGLLFLIKDWLPFCGMYRLPYIRKFTYLMTQLYHMPKDYWKLIEYQWTLVMSHNINVIGSEFHDDFMPNKKEFVKLFKLCSLSFRSGYFLSVFLVVWPYNKTRMPLTKTTHAKIISGQQVSRFIKLIFNITNRKIEKYI